ncbi:hypothetical protein MNV49_000313 [Pseudohyphozyma bogoriensis]|nr:hypothetical protein MNV49_000313 [Pseudohyphozyma bogoriensis]
MKKAIDEAVKEVQETATVITRHLTFADLSKDPNLHYQQDNPSILGYYRQLSGKVDYQSLWYWHNETVNVWSHLLGSFGSLLGLSGAVAVVAGLGELIIHSQNPLAPLLAAIPLPRADMPSVTPLDTLVFSLLLVGSTVCFALSAFYHLTLNHSCKMADLTRKLDFLGIFFLGNMNFIPSFAYGFYCSPELRTLYVGLMTVSCATGAYIVVLSPAFQTPQYRRLRTWVFLIVGWTAALPFGHALYKYGWAEARESMALDWVAAEILLYCGGAIIYAERFPERFAPGWFDLVGSSHQLFHIAAVAAVVCQFMAGLKGFHYRHVSLEGVCA